MIGRVVYLFVLLFIATVGIAEAGAPPAPAPEPGTIALLAAGIGAVGVRALLKRR